MVEKPAWRAFISHSHADEGMARYLHARLERYRVDPALTPPGTEVAADRKLGQFFLDRMGFSGGRPLTEATIAVLDDCAALILLASPDAAASKPVCDEVETFRTRHPDRPLIPFILRGTPAEAFPPMLPRDMLAPDWRKDNVDLGAVGGLAGWLDRTQARPLARLLGWGDLAFAKLVAALLGLADPDRIFRRERRRRRRRAGLIAAAVVLLVAAFARMTVSELDSQSARREVATLTAKLRLLDPAEAKTPGRSDGLESAVADLRERAQTDPKARQIYDLLQASKPAEAASTWDNWLTLQEEQDRARAHRIANDRARQYRELASIRRLTDPGKALADYARAVELDPDNEDGLEWAAQLANDAGDLQAAAKYYGMLENLSAASANGDAAWESKLGLGDVAVGRGNLPEALKSYRDSLAIADRLAKSDPGNDGWQRDLSVSLDRVGDVLVAQGNLPEALTSYRDGLAIRDPLAKSAPGDADWQRDLSVSFDRVGNVLVAQGNLPEALKSYRDSLAIADRLAKSDPGNDGWQRDLSVSLDRVGDVLVAQGNRPEALKSYRDSLAIRDRLARSDQGNAVWQRDLSLSFDRIGDVLVAQGNPSEGLKSYRDSLAIADRLATLDPANAGWQRDLSVSFNKVGDVLVAQGNLLEALESYRDGLAIADRLAKSDPGNAGWQRDLAISNERVGDISTRQGNTDDARRAFQQALDIYQMLVSRNPGDLQSQLFTVVPLWRLASLDPSKGRDYLNAALAILRPLAQANRLDATRLQWIAQIEAQLGRANK